jgi:tRNA C32,U32 (ribose-2'-O)-methylase TrmJ
MTESLLDSLVVVLYEPLDPVNIGATVRAMKNMGVHRLRLIRPVSYDVVRIEGIAHGTMDVIQRIEHFDTFDEAVSDCVYTAAFTARRRSAKIRLVEPREARASCSTPRPTAWSRSSSARRQWSSERRFDRVHVTVTIRRRITRRSTSRRRFIALYELHRLAADATRTIGPPRDAPPPTNTEYEQYFSDAAKSLEMIEFFKTRYPEHIMRTLRSLTFRASPDARELSLLRAMAIEVMNFIERKRRRG